MTKKISAAIAINDHEILLWQYKVLNELINSDYAEIKLIIIIGNTTKQNSHNYHLFYKLHEKLDYFYYRKSFDYNKKTNISSLVNGIPILYHKPFPDNPLNRNSSHTYSEIKDYKLDIILNFGHSIRNETLLKAVRYGILSYHIGDNRVIKGFSNGYWEIVKRLPEIGVNLQLVNSEFKENTVIYRNRLATQPNSLNINRDQIYSLATLLIPRVLKGIHQHGSSFLKRMIEKYNADIEIYNNMKFKVPSFFEAIKNLLAIITRAFLNNYRSVDEGEWKLIYSIRREIYPFNVDFSTFSELEAPKGLYWADPFVISKQHFHYIFIEEYVNKTGKGHISVVKLDQEGKLLGSEAIIEKPYHMSYPFVFEVNNELYMIPETKENKTIELYKCFAFPKKWEFVRNLMEDVCATDSTVFYYKNKWWMFTSINLTEREDIYFYELFLFYSEDLISENWKSHPGNPIITDTKYSRQAGKIFSIGNKIFRPSQDCSGRYGKAFTINQITKLTENEYEEVLISHVEPVWDQKLKGMHTFNFNSEIIVSDVLQQG